MTMHNPTVASMLKKLRPADAAKALGVSVSYLNQLRVRGGGPPFSKLGRRIVIYDADDLETWARAKRRLSTSVNEQYARD